MVDASIPVLNPAGVQEILDYGLVAIALSRHSGCWVSLKCVHDTVEAASSVDVDPDRLPIVFPAIPAPATSAPATPAEALTGSSAAPDDPPVDDPKNPGLGIRWPDTPLEQERRMYEEKLEAVRAFCRANHLDKTVVDSPRRSVGNRHHRQILPRRAAGLRGFGNRRIDGEVFGDSPLQGRPDLSLGAARGAALRRRARCDRGGRGKAGLGRNPAQGDPLRRARRPRHHRQAR